MAGCARARLTGKPVRSAGASAGPLSAIQWQDVPPDGTGSEETYQCRTVKVVIITFARDRNRSRYRSTSVTHIDAFHHGNPVVIDLSPCHRVVMRMKGSGLHGVP